MKRVRKTPIAAPPPGLAKDLALRAQQKLAESYAGFLDDTTEEDPKRFVARSAAAREALEHLAQLRALTMEDSEEEAEPSPEELLAAARAQLAAENKS